MRDSQILELIEIKDKLLVFTGEEFDHQILEQFKKTLKSKGIEPLGICLIPAYHSITAATKQETIDALKEFIKKLEEK